jgi:ATP/maltotriose-dependent transcriptional regulator MalT
MNEEAAEFVHNGWLALQRADWPGAKSQFEAAFQTTDDPEVQDGLGIALWWLNDIGAAHEHRTRAYIGFKNRGETCRAVKIGAWLAREQVFLNSNISAMRGWFSRCERLLNGVPFCVEQGWFHLFRTSMLSSPEELERVALEVLQIAQQGRDADLEALTIAFCGMARVSLGQVSKGMADLDEAMAAAYSGELDYLTINEIFCIMLSACELCGDLARTEHWCSTAEAYAALHHCPFLSAYCRTTYGALLAETGRWQDAERALEEAIHIFDAGHKGLRVHAVIQLADLRISQGRLEEAEVLLSGYEDQHEALLPLARLYQARGETALAKAVLEQALGASTTANFHLTPLLRFLVDLLLQEGDLAAANQQVQKLFQLAEQAQSSLFFAQACLAQGKVMLYAGDDSAGPFFERALSYLQTYDQSILAGRARLEMARLTREKDPPAAITWARAALASFERIGADHDAEEAVHLLRQMGVKHSLSKPSLRARGQDALTQRESEVYTLLCAGLTNRQMADRLVLSEKTVERHVTSILTKLGVNNRAEAIALALKSRPGGGTSDLRG